MAQSTSMRRIAERGASFSACERVIVLSGPSLRSLFQIVCVVPAFAARAHGEDDEVEDRPPLPARHLDDAAVGEELLEVAAHRPVVGARRACRGSAAARRCGRATPRDARPATGRLRARRHRSSSSRSRDFPRGHSSEGFLGGGSFGEELSEFARRRRSAVITYPTTRCQAGGSEEEPRALAGSLRRRVAGAPGL